MRKILLVLLAFYLFYLPLQTYAQWQKMPNGYNLEKFKKQSPKLLTSNNAGTEFWCTFHPCYELSSGGKNYIYVSSPTTTTVTLEIPGKNYLVQKTTIPNDIIAFELDPSVAQPYRKTDMQAPEADNIYVGYGIHIYADQPIIVYGVCNFGYFSDSYLAIPVSALGKEYICASWADVGDDGLTLGDYYTSYTEIVAAYDQTRVIFTLGGTDSTRTAGGMKPGETTLVDFV